MDFSNWKKAVVAGLVSAALDGGPPEFAVAKIPDQPLGHARLRAGKELFVRPFERGL